MSVSLGARDEEGRSGTRQGEEEVAARIEALLAELAATGDPGVAARAEELVRLLVGFYGAGLERVVDLIAEHDRGLLERLARDDLVAALLTLHDLHPADLDTRVRAALDEVRPQLGPHAQSVELLGIDGATVRLRMRGGCDDCKASHSATIEQAVLAAVPEMSSVEVEATAGTGRPALHQIAPLRASL